MPHIILNQKEIALLKSAVRKGDENPEFQKFLLKLDHHLKEWTGEMYLSDNTVELLQHYGCNSNKLSWKAALHSIFGRVMGDNFGSPTDSCTNLIATPKTEQTPVVEDGKNRRVV